MALSDNLTAYWKLDEASGSRADSVGSLTLSENGTVNSGTGIIGTGADFEASSPTYLKVADDPITSLGDNARTFQAWFKIESITGIGGAILSKWDSSSGREYSIYYNSSGVIRFEIRTPSSGNFDAAWGSTLSTGVWYLVHAWHDPTDNLIGISINAGTPVTTSVSGGAQDGNRQFEIGANSNDGYWMDGLIDEVAIWSRVLTSAERTQLYNNGFGWAYDLWSGPWSIIHQSRKLSTGAGDLTSDAFDASLCDLIVVAATYNAYTGGGGGSPPTISDFDNGSPTGNTWNSLTSRTGFDAGTRLYWCKPTVKSTIHTIKFVGANEDSMGILAVSGSATSPLHGESGSNGASGTSVQPGSITPPENNCLFVSAINFFSGTSGSVNSNFNGLFSNGTANAKSTGIAYKIGSSAENPTFSWSGGAVCAAAMAVFKPGAVGGGVVTNRNYIPAFLRARARKRGLYRR